MEPELVKDGLAIYVMGRGRPVFVMPNPQGFLTTPPAESPLAHAIVGTGHMVITFDPPGAFKSTRTPQLGLEEMLNCTEEVLETLGIHEPVDFAAHSQATIPAISLAAEEPTWMRKLVLVGAVAGGYKATRGANGIPWCWGITDPRFWRFNWLASRLMRAGSRGDLARLKKLMQIYVPVSFVDKSKAPRIEIEPGDERRSGPAQARTGWQSSVHSVDLHDCLPGIEMPTLVCAGRFDPQTPLENNREIAGKIPGARLLVFEKSGHYPFIEEPELFAHEVRHFLDAPVMSPITEAVAVG